MRKSFPHEGDFPVIYRPIRDRSIEAMVGLIQDNREELKEELLKHGALLFRNFRVQDVHDFRKVLDALDLGSFVNYIGGDSPRMKVEDPVYTSTEAPPSFKIPLHGEMSFIKHFPQHIYFYCDVEPMDHGETIIADARRVYRALRPSVRERFIEKGLRYTSRYYGKSWLMDLLNKVQRGHKHWMEVFETEDKAEVERLCKENEFDFRWLKGDWLEIQQNRPAITEHPITGEKVWFNQAHLYDFNPKFLGFWRYIACKLFYCRPDSLVHEVCFGDGSEIPREDLYHILDVLDQETHRFAWKKGDILVLDNVLAMHGRAPFSGPRRILTALSS